MNMKKILLTLLLMASTATAALADDISVWDGSSYSTSLDVQDKNIYIRSANDFAALRKLWSNFKGVSGSDGRGYDTFTIYLECDIDLDRHNFIDWCIGWESGNEFGGHFDGQGHVIKNLYIEGKSNNRALFGYLNGGNVRNLKIDRFSVISGDGSQSHVGVLCGRMVNHSTISHCAVVNGYLESINNEGTKSHKDCELGLICGYADGNCNEILYCYAGTSTLIYGNTQIGGIVGKVNNDEGDRTVIKNCYFAGSIINDGNNYYGSIVGERPSNKMENIENNFYWYIEGTGRKAIGSSSGSEDVTDTAIKACTAEEIKVPLLFGADDTEWVYPQNGLPELKVFLRYNEGDTFYEKNIGNTDGTVVPGYLKVVSNENTPYTVELTKIVSGASGNNFTLNGDFTPYFSDQSLRMVGLPANALESMGTLNTVTLPATLTTIGVPQRHQVQNAFYLNGEGTGCGVKDGALYDLTNNRLITAPKSLSSLTIRQQYADKIAEYAFENMTGLKTLYIDTYVPAGTTVDDKENPAPLITLEGDNTFSGCPSDLDIYVKDGTTNQLFLGKQGPGINYGYSNADKWKEFYYDYADKPNHMFSYFPVQRNPGRMSTLMLGYPVELPEGVKAYWARSLSDGNVHLSSINSQIVPALTPVLLTYEGSSDPLYLTRYEGSGAGAATDYEKNLFKGSVDPGGHTMTSSEMMSNFFTLGRPTGVSTYDNLGFYRYNPTNNILPSYVAWIANSDVPSEARLAFTFGDEATDIDSISAPSDGEMRVFTLQGSRIHPSAMRRGGLYIVNGKKVINR